MSNSPSLVDLQLQIETAKAPGFSPVQCFDGRHQTTQPHGVIQCNRPRSVVHFIGSVPLETLAHIITYVCMCACTHYICTLLICFLRRGKPPRGRVWGQCANCAQEQAKVYNPWCRGRATQEGNPRVNGREAPDTSSRLLSCALSLLRAQHCLC